MDDIKSLVWRLQYAKRRHVALMNRVENTEKGAIRDGIEKRAERWKEIADKILEKIKELESCEDSNSRK